MAGAGLASRLPRLPRESAAEAPTLKDFECEPCKAKRMLQSDSAIEKLAKCCPKCEAPTVKISGCNHMTCPCDTHWCWQCGCDFPESEIYDHMQTEHGTLGLDGDDDDFNDGEE